MGLDIKTTSRLLKETREFVKASREAKNVLQEAKEKDSPGGATITAEERIEVVKAFAEAGEELAQLLGVGAPIAKEIAEFIKEKLK